MKQAIGITLDERLLTTIDNRRSTPAGQVSRSAFIEMVLKNHIGGHSDRRRGEPR